MKTKVLKMIRESKDYVSGQMLCETLGVSRTAVWKAIQKLKDMGYKIEGVSNKGYRLIESPDFLFGEEIESRMHTKWAGKPVKCFECVNSTNTQAKMIAEQNGKVHGTLVVAEEQESGKGRRGRVWKSQKGTGIWMSLIVQPKISPQNASMLTLVAAMAVASGIQKETGLEVKIKWPNDIVVSGKKVCGILTEMSSEQDYIHYVIVGIGINVYTKEFPEEIQKVATSIQLENGTIDSRSQLIATIIEQFEKYYEAFLEKEDISLFLEEYHYFLANYKKRVQIIERNKSYEGIALGVDEKGELLVQLEDGNIKKVVSGEVSVRGIYGYV